MPSAERSTNFGSILIFSSCLLVIVIYYQVLYVGNFFLDGRGPVLFLIFFFSSLQWWVFVCNHVMWAKTKSEPAKHTHTLVRLLFFAVIKKTWENGTQKTHQEEASKRTAEMFIPYVCVQWVCTWCMCGIKRRWWWRCDHLPRDSSCSKKTKYIILDYI